MKKVPIVMMMLAALFIFALPAQADFTIGGITFADNAGADSLISYEGTYSNNSTGVLSAAQLQGVLTDGLVSTYAFLSTPSLLNYVNLGFTNNVLVNGPGNDLALFDLGDNAIFRLYSINIGGSTQDFSTTFTGITTNTPENITYNINVALIDLSSYGLAEGASISSVGIFIGMDQGVPKPSLAFIGTLQSVTAVPEPSTLLLMGSGLMGVVVFGRRKFKK